MVITPLLIAYIERMSEQIQIITTDIYRTPLQESGATVQGKRKAPALKPVTQEDKK